MSSEFDLLGWFVDAGKDWKVSQSSSSSSSSTSLAWSLTFVAVDGGGISSLCDGILITKGG
ncbi:hypothetical protein HanXRQr2_Chr09g0394321 [Helianthus annuus]|uniref:Uncharacterized protein n=1 Tax=Helianthus annuus TaxID=4232 RepID=A0A9K3I756_HELAN|nr:hypothetical protein HanXRQr2_Chr09g0394321 [Helianthus annuus]KAJ0893649.1 hypothetical protein HanPSC8_Chr09g0380181 [Helianthus annuus]